MTEAYHDDVPRQRAMLQGRPVIRFRASRQQSQLGNMIFSAKFTFAGVLLALCIALALVGIITGDQGVIYCATAVLMFLIPASVGLLRMRKFDILEPINIMAAAIFFGTTLRSFYLLLASDHPQAQFLMMRQDFSDINRNTAWVILGIVMICIGYMFPMPRLKLERWPLIRGFYLRRSRLTLAMVISVVLTVVGISAYFTAFNIELSDGILSASQKRQVEYLTETGDVIYGSGWRYVLSQTTQYTFLIYVSALLCKAIPSSWINLTIPFGLFLLLAVVPFLSSSRTPIILSLFAACVLGYYYRRLNMKTILISFIGLVFIVAAMGSLRATNQRVDDRGSFIASTLGSGNGFDAVRVTAIIDRMPRMHDFLYGQSYAAIPVFFVPRAVWPEKPSSGLGAFVKAELFGELNVRNAGWPPSIVGEAYINFGFLGIVFILPIIGAGFRLFYESCKPLLGKSLPVTTIYSIAAYRLGFNCVELNLGQGLVTLGIMLVPMIAFLWLCRGSKVQRLCYG